MPTNPPIETNVFRGRLFWLGREPLTVGNRYTLKLGTRETAVAVAVDRAGDRHRPICRPAPADTVERNAVAEVVLRSAAACSRSTSSPNNPVDRPVCPG